MKLIIHLHLVSQLRISGAVPLLPLLVYMEWTGKLYLYLYYPDMYPDRLRKSRKVRTAGLRGQETILEHCEYEGVLLFNHTSL